jgi:hypothetical protein
VSAPDRRPARRRRLPRILALQLVAWPLALVVGELGLRGVLAASGAAYSAEETRAELAELRERNRAFVPRPNNDLPWSPTESERAERVLQPYVGYDIVGGLQLLEDQMRDFKKTPDGRVYHVAIFGGSVAQMFATQGGPRLRRELEADPRFAGTDVRFLSFARGGFRQPQLQAFLAYLLALGIEPDAVIVLDGFNEVAIGKQNARLGTHVSFPSVPHWAQLLARGADRPAAISLAAGIRGAQRELDEFTTWALERGLERSAIGGELALRRARTLRRRALEGIAHYTNLLRSGQARRALAGPPFPEDLADPVAAAVAEWRESSRNMRAMCEARGIAYFHVLQPTLHDPGAKPVHPNEARLGTIDPDWLDGVQRGYPALRAAGAELAAQGERFFDASRIFAEVAEPLYFDACHLTGKGNDLLAAALGAAFLEALR